MTLFDVLDAGITALVVVLAFRFWKKHIHRPRVWVIDDSEMDLSLFKLNIKLDDCDIRYFTKADNIINEYIKSILCFNSPTCVVVDYYLSSNIKGDEVLNHFRANGVPAVVVTGHDGDISGIAKRDIIHKTPDPDYFRQVEYWVNTKTGKA